MPNQYIDTKGVKERLISFVISQQLNFSQFERRCGLANGYIKNIRRSISSEKLGAILKAFPCINRTWLLTGEGEMMLPQEGKVTQTASGSDIVQTVGSGPDALVKAIDEIGQMRVALTDALHVNQQNTSRLFDLLDRVTDRLSSPPPQNCP